MSIYCKWWRLIANLTIFYESTKLGQVFGTLNSWDATKILSGEPPLKQFRNKFVTPLTRPLEPDPAGGSTGSFNRVVKLSSYRKTFWNIAISLSAPSRLVKPNFIGCLIKIYRSLISIIKSVEQYNCSYKTVSIEWRAFILITT